MEVELVVYATQQQSIYIYICMCIYIYIKLLFKMFPNLKCFPFSL